MANKIIPLRRVAKHKKRRLQRRIAAFATQIPTQHLDEAKIWSRGRLEPFYGQPTWINQLRARYLLGEAEPLSRPASPVFSTINIEMSREDYQQIFKSIDDDLFKNEYLNIPPQ